MKLNPNFIILLAAIAGVTYLVTDGSINMIIKNMVVWMFVGVLVDGKVPKWWTLSVFFIGVAAMLISI